MPRASFSLLLALALAVPLSACGTDDPDQPSPSSAAAADATPQESSTPDETQTSETAASETSTEESDASEGATPSEEPVATTSDAPAETTDTQTAGLDAHAWCDLMEEKADELPDILVDWPGEWGEFRRLDDSGEEPDASDESISCGRHLGEPLQAGYIGLAVEMHEDEAAADALVQRLREDSSDADPGVITNEDLPDNDGVLYTTYSAPASMPPFVSYSATWSDGPRVLRLSLRDYRADVVQALGAGQAPPDEAQHRAHVEEILAILGR